jgi:HPr kinase/phosphorylase
MTSPDSDKTLNNEDLQTAIHGVLLEIFGIGVLLIGEAGIGKSEAALEMILRGHRLVADDAVEISKTGNKLFGAAPELSYEQLEVRGLGILNVRSLFGPGSTIDKAAIELCVELVSREQFDPPDRIEPAVSAHNILDLSVPKFTIPARPDRDLSNLLETAVRVFILSNAGFDNSRLLIEKHTAMVNKAG